MAKSENTLAALIGKHQGALMDAWLAGQKRDSRLRGSGTDAASADLARQFLDQLHRGVTGGQTDDINGAGWAPMRELLEDFSRSRATQGFSPSETAIFVFSLKEPLFEMLRRELGADAEQIGRETWTITRLMDALGLYTIESYARTREEVIGRQQQELLELSTPVVELWDGILALPLIGTLDSARTQIVMENLLERIVDVGSRDRHHRHHRRADRRYAGRAAPDQDHRGRPADGRRLHHQRHPAADRADHRPSWRRVERRLQGDHGRRTRRWRCAAPAR